MPLWVCIFNKHPYYNTCLFEKSAPIAKVAFKISVYIDHTNELSRTWKARFSSLHFTEVTFCLAIEYRLFWRVRHCKAFHCCMSGFYCKGKVTKHRTNSNSDNYCYTLLRPQIISIHHTRNSLSILFPI